MSKTESETVEKTRKPRTLRPLILQSSEDEGKTWQDVGTHPDEKSAIAVAKENGKEGMYRTFRVGPTWNLKKRETIEVE